jgi:hypothetical protein
MDHQRTPTDAPGQTAKPLFSGSNPLVASTFTLRVTPRAGLCLFPVASMVASLGLVQLGEGGTASGDQDAAVAEQRRRLARAAGAH